MMQQKPYGPGTLAVHAGYTPDSAQQATVAPIYQTNAYTFDSVEQARNRFALTEGGNIYSRLTNPTVAVLEEKVAAMDGGVAAIAMSSGHAVLFNTILNLAGAGDEIVSSICIYGGAINLLGVTLDRIGIKVKFVDPDDFGAWETAISEKTKALFVEVIGNPNANVADLEKLAELAHKHRIPLIADSTFTTPAICRPIEYGADLVVHSATKYLGGHGSSMGGVVVDSGRFPFEGNEKFPLYNEPDPSYHGVVFAKDAAPACFASRMRAILLRDIGACLSPFNAFMIQQGMETLHLRMPRHCDNSLRIAQYLNAHPQVDFVHYPGLESNPYYPLVQKYLKGYGGSVFTFGLKGGRESGVRFIESLEIFGHVTNLGDTRSQVSHPATTTHSQLTDEQLRQAGISAGTVRISVGIEDSDDLIADLEQAIAASV